MKKGISLFFGFNLPAVERMKMIAAAGFDCVITSADPAFATQNLPIGEQVKQLKKHGLQLSTLHATYRTDELPFFWQPGERGEQIKQGLIHDVEIAKQYGFTAVVVHLVGEYSALGETRLREVLQVCEKLDVPLAIENINCQEIFVQVFAHIQHPYLKFCYDTGHHNCFDPGFDYLGKYGDKLIALHIHNNDGSGDQHTLNRYGSYQWEQLAQVLATKPDIALDYEMLLCHNPENLSPETVLKITKQQADELEKLIKIK